MNQAQKGQKNNVINQEEKKVKNGAACNGRQ